ncbi:MAG: type II secretion system protein [Armatimonadetes bacterium]|nr:type II secretion system protein [Armatimonadota bacterium]MBS1710695.1 type II secretion system protein [Armatimonadota bacterium]MBX3108366.1 type II secretion system protein [Fimbriimonadaceae bacterium]
MSPRRAFSLVELLVVIAIVSAMAAVLFPVFSQAKMQAFQISWIESARQISLGTALYTDDYDQRYFLPRHNPEPRADATNDRTWVQSLLPYANNFELFFCPVDDSAPKPVSVFDPDLTAGNPLARYYEKSMRANYGYNYAYFSPIFKQAGQWVVTPRSQSDVADPSRTMLFGDSAWQVRGGRPSGGGSYLVIPPCRFQREGGQLTDSFGLQSAPNTQVFGNGLAWQAKAAVWESDAGAIYPWFHGMVTVTHADGHVKPLPYSRMTNGCDVQPGWRGLIYDTGRYLWDLR